MKVKLETITKNGKNKLQSNSNSCLTLVNKKKNYMKHHNLLTITPALIFIQKITP